MLYFVKTLGPICTRASSPWERERGHAGLQGVVYAPGLRACMQPLHASPTFPLLLSTACTAAPPGGRCCGGALPPGGPQPDTPDMEFVHLDAAGEAGALVTDPAAQTAFARVGGWVGGWPGRAVGLGGRARVRAAGHRNACQPKGRALDFSIRSA